MAVVNAYKFRASPLPLPDGTASWVRLAVVARRALAAGVMTISSTTADEWSENWTNI